MFQNHGKWSLINQHSEFWLSKMILKVKEYLCHLSLDWGFWGHLRLAMGIWHIDPALDMVTDPLYTHDPNFGSLSWFWRCKEHSCPLRSYLGLWRMLEAPDLGLASWSWFVYGHWSLIHPWSKFWLSIRILKVQRTSMSFKSSLGALENAGGSWLGFGILILIWIWSLVFDKPMIQI